MRQICFLKSILLTLVFLTTSAYTFAADEPVSLSADSLTLNQATGLYRAEGDVLIEQGDLHLTSDAADWNQGSGEAFCIGDVAFEFPDGILTGESLTYDFNSGFGLLRNGQADLTTHSVFLSGETIEKRGEISYRVTGGSFTTCEGAKPTWKLTASSLDVDVEGYARAKHAVFYLHDIPVLYLPYLALPAKSERQSGLLFPEFGHSNRLGNQFAQSYYQVIDDHMDATLTLDYMSDFGVGTGLEYRYLLPKSHPGRLFGNYISGANGEPDRALVEWAHDGRLPGDIRLVANVEYVNKKDYFEVFGGNADVYASEKSQSTLYLSKAWDKTVLAGQSTYTRDLEQSSKNVLQYLPEVRLAYVPQRIGETPVFASLLGESAYLWRREGLKGTRSRLKPTVSTDLLVSRYLEIVPELSWLQRHYNFDGNDEAKGIPEAAVTIGSRLSRIFTVNGEHLSHVRHAVEPMLHYRYIPNVDQSDLPQFDSRDQVGPLNLLTFELMNRFTARFKGRGTLPIYREVASFRLAVDYDIDEERRSVGPAPDKKRPFSPIRGELILRPTDNSFLRGDIAYDANDNAEQVENWAVWGGFHDRQGNGFLLNYNYDRIDYDYLSGGIDLALLSPLFASYEQRRDLEENKKLEDIVQLEYRGQCWSLLVSYSDRPDEEKVSLKFTLSGLSDSRLSDPVSRSLKNFL